MSPDRPHIWLPALAIFTRVPGSGPVKTRLAAALGRERAEALARAFLLDTLARAHALPVAHSLWYTPARAEASLIRLLAAGSPDRWALRHSRHRGEGEAPAEPADPFVGSAGASPSQGSLKPLFLVAQPPGPLDLRLEAALRCLLARGHGRVCVIGSDSPTLPVRRIHDAFEALDDADFVLVPAEDGGFVLLGARACPPGLLTGIDWSTERVCDQTHARLARGGSVTVLDAAYDIDTPADLGRLASDPELDGCPRTLAALRSCASGQLAP